MTAAAKKKRTLLAILPLAAALLLFGFIACDPGSEPDGPTGPNAQYLPLIDDPAPGVTARVSPGRVAVPNVATGDLSARAILIGTYRDPGNNPVPGLQMNFKSDPVTPTISFNPPAGFTDSNGAASTEVIVGETTPSGSYILVAFTSPASGGPNAEGQTTLFVNQVGVQGVDDLVILTASLVDGQVGVAYSQTLAADGGVEPYLWSVLSGLPGSLSLVGDTIQGNPIAADAGTTNVTVRVTDSNVPPDSALATFSLTIAP